VAAIPAGLPIMILPVLGPLVTAATHLDRAHMRPLLVVGVLVAIGVGVLGLQREGPGIADGVPTWAFDLFLLIYLAAHMVFLTWPLNLTNRAIARADADLRRSRRRVVVAGDEERVRLERNLHDGAQQRLVALAVQLQLAEQLTRRGQPPSAEQLAELHQDSRAAIDELRELASGIYPSVLSERGLAHALQRAADRASVPVVVSIDRTVQPSPADAAAVYFICLEGLQNAAKHAPDATVHLTVSRLSPTRGLVEIADDGPGFDPVVAASGRGLANIADRAGALGARLSVDSAPGAGTRLSLVVPVGADTTGTSRQPDEMVHR